MCSTQYMSLVDMYIHVHLVYKILQGGIHTIQTCVYTYTVVFTIQLVQLLCTWLVHCCFHNTIAIFYYGKVSVECTCTVVYMYLGCTSALQRLGCYMSVTLLQQTHTHTLHVCTLYVSGPLQCATLKLSISH